MIGAGMDPIFDEMKKVPVCSSLSEAVSYVCGDGVVIEKKQPVHGGDANEAYKLFLSDGTTLFLKANTLSNIVTWRSLVGKFHVR